MTERLKIYYQNKTIHKNGYYIDDSGEKITFDDNFDKIIKNTEVFNKLELVQEVSRDKEFLIRENTVNAGTINTILKLRKDGIKGNITALNFANAMVQGGGYRFGGNAQEESLCRASMLYYSLKSAPSMYRYNRKRITPVYSDVMIYSKNVPVFRNDEGVFLPHIEECSFITSPAVYRSMARFFYSEDNINKIMEQRISKIISLAVSQGSEAIVLGAFGCGVFGNKRDVVLPMIERVVNKYVPSTVKVVFSQV